MMPATESNLHSGTSTFTVVCEQEHLAGVPGPIQYVSEILRATSAYLFSPDKVGSPFAYGTAIPTPLATYFQGDTTKIDFDLAENAMRKLAQEQRLDFDQLLKKASQHFGRPEAGPGQVHLTVKDIAGLVEDDDRAIDE